MSKKRNNYISKTIELDNQVNQVKQETIKKEYDAKAAELASLRAKYAAMNEVQRVQIAAQIRLTETAFERLAADKLALEKEIRHIELNK